MMRESFRQVDLCFKSLSSSNWNSTATDEKISQRSPKTQNSVFYSVEQKGTFLAEQKQPRELSDSRPKTTTLSLTSLLLVIHLSLTLDVDSKKTTEIGRKLAGKK